MSYEKQTWQTGDVVTSAKLNHMEDGIEAASGGGDASVLIVNVTADAGNPDLFVCDKTAAEMFAADVSVLKFSNGNKRIIVSASIINPGSADKYMFLDTDENTYEATSPSDYPQCDMS